MQTGIIIFVGCMAVVVAGCHSDTRQDQTGTDIIEYNEYQPIEWTPDGKHLLIKNRWWYTPADKTFITIAQPPAAVRTVGYWTLLPSPDSDQLLWLGTESEQMQISKFNEAPLAVIAIPIWLSLEAWQPKENRLITPFWLNNKDIFVQQSDYHSDKTACGIFNTESQEWLRLPDNACIKAGFTNLGSVEYLQDQTYLVYSAAEGHSSLDVMNIDVGNMKQTVNLELTFGSFGTFGAEVPDQVQYRDPKHIKVLFRCELDQTQERPECAEYSKGPALYSWAASKKKLRLLHLNLPNHIAMSHVHDQIAWLDKEAICVGKPGEKEPSSCTPLPAIQR